MNIIYLYKHVQEKKEASVVWDKECKKVILVPKAGIEFITHTLLAVWVFLEGRRKAVAVTGIGKVFTQIVR